MLHLLDFPVLYASGRSGWASKEIDGPRENLQPLLNLIIDHVKPSTFDETKPFKKIVIRNDNKFEEISNAGKEFTLEFLTNGEIEDVNFINELNYLSFDSKENQLFLLKIPLDLLLSPYHVYVTEIDDDYLQESNKIRSSNDVLKEQLELPEHIVPVAYLCLGHVTNFEDKPDLERSGWLPRLELKDVVYYEKWEQKEDQSWNAIQDMIKSNLNYA